jgi:hypothetical protein
MQAQEWVKTVEVGPICGPKTIDRAPVHNLDLSGETQDVHLVGQSS